ncbi:hypothetical protein G7046_g9567 [Stylonectria norvegica]|nr:hypothetical protein G7046_g9567 [Stylonectria norvegica]
MRRLSPRGRTLDDELADLDEDEDVADDFNGAAETQPLNPANGRVETREEAERRAMDVVTNGGWGRGGASGVLVRKGSSQSSLGRGVSPRFQDEGVD